MAHEVRGSLAKATNRIKEKDPLRCQSLSRYTKTTLDIISHMSQATFPAQMAHMGVLSGAGLSLPVEVLEVVLSQLPYNFLITTCTSVCRLWYEVIRNPASNNPPAVSHDVWDVHALIRLLLRPGSLFSPCVVVEAFYSIAVFLFHTTTSSHICLPMRKPNTTTLPNTTAQPNTTLPSQHHNTTLPTPQHYPTPHCPLNTTTLPSQHHNTTQPTPHASPTRYHYQVFYALYLYENDWGGLLEEGQVVRQEQHAGQQSMERYVQRKMAIQYTHEQLRIINHPLQSDHIVKIVAFAGTGKTTTLLELCKKRPDLNFLLVVFNKSVQEYCSLSFPKNTTVKTAHSMAYGFVGRKLRRVALVKKALQRFFNSSDERLTLQHTPTVDKHGEQIEDDFRLQVILADAEAVWAEMTKCSRHQQISMTQDGQLKVWQLSRPRLLQYDVVMIDEGQDMSPSMLDIFLCQACAKVLLPFLHHSTNPQQCLTLPAVIFSHL
ncbi:F-box DNA helicase 1 [Portunus trituberculatus]|uniref:F-box DNA helicase 1 n=1 Tax=Portunus trituberculatus TaxID=210409 RepID=A0A5B7DJJ1_PORTR|nr:F-box DNA helicase 1 [Portunus trituberculatus]